MSKAVTDEQDFETQKQCGNEGEENLLEKESQEDIKLNFEASQVSVMENVETGETTTVSDIEQPAPETRENVENMASVDGKTVEDEKSEDQDVVESEKSIVDEFEERFVPRTPGRSIATDDDDFVLGTSPDEVSSPLKRQLLGSTSGFKRKVDDPKEPIVKVKRTSSSEDISDAQEKTTTDVSDENNDLDDIVHDSQPTPPKKKSPAIQQKGYNPE